MLFKTIPRVNTLYHDKGPCTTQHIDYILSQHIRVLLIVDETSTHDYSISSVQKLTIYKIIFENCLEERAVINFKKFIILVKQGYIGMNSFDLFIFRLNGMSKELMECFKIFYLYNPSKKLVICYFNIIEKLDYIYMACEYDTQFKNVYNVFVDPVDDIEATNYSKLKSMIFESKSICPGVKNKITELENITYKYALLYIRKKFNLEIDSNASIQTDPKLAMNDYKFENTLQIIKENNNLQIYIKCINKNVIKFLKLQTENDVQEYVKGVKNLENSILIIYDSFEDFGYEMNFQKIYIYHEDKCKANLYALFRNFSIDENNVNYLSQKYHKEELKYTMIGSTGAFYDYTSSYTLLMHFFYLLQQMLKDEYFYLKCSNLCCDYLESLGKFQCKITFPFLHEQFEPISGTFQPNKIEARKCTAYKSLEFLIKNGFMDDHLCPIKERFINKNKIYYRYIFETYKLDTIADNLSLHSTHTGKGLTTNLDGYDHDALIAQIESIKHEYINNIAKTSEFTPSRISAMFERDHRIDLGFDQVVEKYDFAFDVKLPKALSSYSKTYNIYRCKHLLPDTDVIDCKLGLCTSQSFTETLIFHDSEISYVGTHEFDNTELECLLFFQTILFLLNFKKIKLVSTPAKEYFYFLVPIKNGRIDFDYLKTLDISKFLIQNVAQLEDKSLLKENFLYNPYNEKFYIYDKPCKGLITDLALFDKNTRYIDYYESKYNVKLKNRTGNDLLFIGYLFSGVPSSQSNILSTEILYVTNLKVSFCKDFNLIKKFLFAFEKMASAYELKQNMNAKITTQNMLKCLTPKDQDFDNYERLEFLGDTVLKFVCSGHLFNYTLGDCVTRKDKLISNESLFEIAKNHGIINYFSFIKYSEVMFQPPNILKFMDDEALGMQFAKCVDYFKAKDIFLSKNVTFQESKVKTIDDKVKGLKTYADIIEAMIGAHFIEFGLRESTYFIEALGITKKDDKGSNSDEYNEQIANKSEIRDKQSRLSNNERKQIEQDSRTQEKATLENGLTGSLEFIKDGYKKMCIINEMKEYKNILKVDEIAGIERILNYKFNYPGLIEKAMIHPSSHNNVLGSINFNKLELLGDCALDLVVTEKIYHELVDLDPEGMHCKRKSLVNNFSLARVLFKMKLDVYLHICFDDKHKDNVARKLRTDGETVNKAFGDVLESICGAILLDMDSSYLRFKDYVINNLYNELENCSDATR